MKWKANLDTVLNLTVSFLIKAYSRGWVRPFQSIYAEYSLNEEYFNETKLTSNMSTESSLKSIQSSLGHFELYGVVVDSLTNISTMVLCVFEHVSI